MVSQAATATQERPYLANTPMSFAFSFLKPLWFLLLPLICCEIGQSCCQILIPAALRDLVDFAEHLDRSHTQLIDFWQPLLKFACLSFGILLFSRASGSLVVLTGPRLRRNVRAAVYHYLQHHSHRYFLNHFAGSLANRVSEISVGVNHAMWMLLLDFLPTCLVFFISFILIFKTHFHTGLYLSIWIILFVSISYLLARRCQEYAKAAAETRSVVTGKIVDAITNILTTKFFALGSFERHFLGTFLDAEVTAARRTFWFMEKIRWFQFSATLLLQVCMVVFSLKIWIQHEITLGTFMMITGLTTMVINDSRNLSRRFLEFFEYIGNISEGVQVITTEHEIVDQKNAHTLSVRKAEIKFNHVSFYYRPELTIFTDLNTTIAAGSKVGLVGYSGSGKTTFVNLIMRLYDLKGGSITIDGQNIASVTQDSLRQQISMIPQEPLLFHRSLMENIRYGRIDASDAEVIEAAKQAMAHDFILQQKEGYHTLVGERGIKLSGGQRQRIAIARAILKQAPILIMDEASSSLDSVSEKFIQEALIKVMVDKTVIIIAHRLATVANLDRILVFQDQKIIEDGSHNELLQQQGYYHRLWQMQAGGFLCSDIDALEAEIAA